MGRGAGLDRMYTLCVGVGLLKLCLGIAMDWMYRLCVGVELLRMCPFG